MCVSVCCIRSRSDKVPLREVKCHHVIKYEEQLQSLLLSHAHYSLALGQGSVLTYDFEGVERQLMEQLFQDKPLILAEHMRFEYIREAYNLAVFDKVRFKVQQVRYGAILLLQTSYNLFMKLTCCRGA